jgi:hypothetical protein
MAQDRTQWRAFISLKLNLVQANLEASSTIFNDISMVRISKV